MGDYRTTKPEEIWKKIRDGEITEPTAGMCGGYAQANLVILPKKYAEDFKKFAEFRLCCSSDDCPCRC